MFCIFRMRRKLPQNRPWRRSDQVSKCKQRAGLAEIFFDNTSMLSGVQKSRQGPEQILDIFGTCRCSLTTFNRYGSWGLNGGESGIRLDLGRKNQTPPPAT
eukprot:1150589-Pelagomonas_calceolata.AAC.6